MNVVRWSALVVGASMWACGGSAEGADSSSAGATGTGGAAAGAGGAAGAAGAGGAAPAPPVYECNAGLPSLGSTYPEKATGKKGTNGTFFDTCKSESTLIDYVCEISKSCGANFCEPVQTGQVVPKEIACDTPCADGACEVCTLGIDPNGKCKLPPKPTCVGEGAVLEITGKPESVVFQLYDASTGHKWSCLLQANQFSVICEKLGVGAKITVSSDEYQCNVFNSLESCKFACNLL